MKGASIFSKIPELDYEENLRPVSPELFENIIQNRRSTRVYTDEKIPEEVMQKVLDWALLAPNSSNLQPWEFYWVRNPVAKEQLVKALLSQPAARTAQEIIVAVAKLKNWKKHSHQMLELFENSPQQVPDSAKAYYKKLVPFIYSQGSFGVFGLVKKVLFMCAGLVKVVPREPTSHADMRVWAHKSVALACENIMLGLSSFGVDSCPLEGYDSSRVKKILGLGSESEIVMCISVGKRAKSGIYGPRVRMPREQFIKIID